MRNLKKYFRSLPFVAMCLLVLGGAAAFAQKQFMVINSGRPEVKVLLTGVVERENGRVPVEKAEMVKSGETLDWTIISENAGNADAREYKAVGHIPAGMTFVAGSAQADKEGKTFYSIDKGKTFSVQPLVDERQADGSIKKVPAPVSMYTDIRYEWADPLAEGGKLSASYKVRVN